MGGWGGGGGGGGGVGREKKRCVFQEMQETNIAGKGGWVYTSRDERFEKRLTQWSMQWMKSNSSSVHVSEVLVLFDTRSLHVPSVSFSDEHFLVSPHFSLSTS